MNNIKKTTLRELWKNKVFSNISKLRINENNYPYVTFVKDKTSTNVYFGKKTAKIVGDTFEIGEDLIANQFLLDAELIETTNAQGEKRYKLSKTMGDYSSSASLEEAFGSPSENSFDFEGFKSTFEAAKAATIEA